MPFTDSLRFVEIIRAEKYQLTAKPEDVANGKTYVGTTRQLEVGTLPVHEEHGDITLVAGETYKVAYGKVPKDYNVVVKPLADQTPGTATADKILYPYTAVVNGETVTGTMPDNPPENVELASGESYNIPIGYHDGTEMITATALGNQTPGTATESDIVAGKTAWVNGMEIMGTVPEIFAEDINISAGKEYTIPYGKHSGQGKVIGPNIEDITQADATTEDIVDGKTAWVNGKLVTGSIPKIAAQTITFPFNGSYTIPYGLHSGLGQLVQNIESVEEQIVIAPSFEEQTIDTAGKFLVQDILVPGINALNYEILSDDSGYIINVPAETDPIDDSMFKVPVDNWHDHCTLNVYQVEVGDSEIVYAFINNIGNNISSAGKNGYTITTEGFEVALTLEKDTNSHFFTYNEKRGARRDFRVKELFHARRFGDEHDKTPTAYMKSGSEINSILKELLKSLGSEDTHGLTVCPNISVTHTLPDGATKYETELTAGDTLENNKAYFAYNPDGSDATIYIYSPAEIVQAPEDCSHMFQNLGASDSSTIDLSGLDFSSTTDMSYMFNNNIGFKIILGDTKTSNIADVSHMFDNAQIKELSGTLHISPTCEDMSYMFNNSSIKNASENADILGANSWNTSGVKYMKNFAYRFNNTESIYASFGFGIYPSLFSNFDMSNAENADSMFESVIWINEPIDVSKWNLNKVDSAVRMFAGSFVLNSDEASSSEDIDINNLYKIDCELNFANTTFAALVNASQMFANSIYGDIKFKEGSFQLLTNASQMFYNSFAFINSENHTIDFTNASETLNLDNAFASMGTTIQMNDDVTFNCSKLYDIIVKLPEQYTGSMNSTFAYAKFNNLTINMGTAEVSSASEMFNRTVIGNTLTIPDGLINPDLYAPNMFKESNINELDLQNISSTDLYDPEDETVNQKYKEWFKSMYGSYITCYQEIYDWINNTKGITLIDFDRNTFNILDGEVDTNPNDDPKFEDITLTNGFLSGVPIKNEDTQNYEYKQLNLTNGVFNNDGSIQFEISEIVDSDINNTTSAFNVNYSTKLNKNNAETLINNYKTWNRFNVIKSNTESDDYSDNVDYYFGFTTHTYNNFFRLSFEEISSTYDFKVGDTIKIVFKAIDPEDHSNADTYAIEIPIGFTTPKPYIDEYTNLIYKKAKDSPHSPDNAKFKLVSMDRNKIILYHLSHDDSVSYAEPIYTTLFTPIATDNYNNLFDRKMNCMKISNNDLSFINKSGLDSVHIDPYSTTEDNPIVIEYIHMAEPRRNMFNSIKSELQQLANKYGPINKFAILSENTYSKEDCDYYQMLGDEYYNSTVLLIKPKNENNIYAYLGDYVNGILYLSNNFNVVDNINIIDLTGIKGSYATCENMFTGCGAEEIIFDKDFYPDSTKMTSMFSNTNNLKKISLSKHFHDLIQADEHHASIENIDDIEFTVYPEYEITSMKNYTIMNTGSYITINDSTDAKYALTVDSTYEYNCLNGDNYAIIFPKGIAKIPDEELDSFSHGLELVVESDIVSSDQFDSVFTVFNSCDMYDISNSGTETPIAENISMTYNSRTEVYGGVSYAYDFTAPIVVEKPFDLATARIKIVLKTV